MNTTDNVQPEIATLDSQWEQLTSKIETFYGRFNTRSVADAYERLFDHLRYDRVRPEGTLLGFFRAPASKNRHHDYEGGLVVHLNQMWNLWSHAIKPHLERNWLSHPSLTDANVWSAIVHHDLNKVWRYRLVDGSLTKWTVAYSDDYQNDMLGQTHKSLQILMRFQIPLPIMLHNALITSEAGYSDVRPQSETAFAKLLSSLDELSCVHDRLARNRFWDSQKTGTLHEIL